MVAETFSQFTIYRFLVCVRCTSLLWHGECWGDEFKAAFEIPQLYYIIKLYSENGQSTVFYGGLSVPY